MRNKLFLLTGFIVCLTTIILFSSCEKNKSGVVTYYGNVVDKSNGNPISAAEVSISFDFGESSVITGSDGSYELPVYIPGGFEKNRQPVIIKVTRYNYFSEYKHIAEEGEFKKDLIGQKIQVSFTLDRRKY